MFINVFMETVVARLQDLFGSVFEVYTVYERNSGGVLGFRNGGRVGSCCFFVDIVRFNGAFRNWRWVHPTKRFYDY